MAPGPGMTHRRARRDVALAQRAHLPPWSRIPSPAPRLMATATASGPRLAECGLVSPLLRRPPGFRGGRAVRTPADAPSPTMAWLAAAAICSCRPTSAGVVRPSGRAEAHTASMRRHCSIRSWVLAPSCSRQLLIRRKRVRRTSVRRPGADSAEPRRARGSSLAASSQCRCSTFCRRLVSRSFSATAHFVRPGGRAVFSGRRFQCSPPSIRPLLLWARTSGPQPMDRHPIVDPPRPEVVSRRRIRFSLVWLAPVLAAMIALSLFFERAAQQGPDIVIRFKSAQGIEPGKTPVRYKDVQIGVVTAVDLSPTIARLKITDPHQPQGRAAHDGRRLVLDRAPARGAHRSLRPRDTFLRKLHRFRGAVSPTAPSAASRVLDNAMVVAADARAQVRVGARGTRLRIDVGLPIYHLGIQSAWSSRATWQRTARAST